MRYAIAALALMASIGCTTAKGEKIGTITKLAEQGPICPTWEGQIIRGGLSDGSGAFGAPFDFTIQDTSLLERVRAYMESGQEVKIYYYSYEPTFCSSDSGHFVTRVEPVRSAR
jgi:hypothetical protein